VLETQDIIEEVIANLDNDTTLVLYGDHGMTNDGNHGGGSQNEIKTVFFAVNKGGIPMLKNKDLREKLEADDSFLKLKQLDIASIASHLLDQPIPFSSLGILHPMFGGSLKSLPYKMLGNL